jgi:hypothetical protein
MKVEELLQEALAVGGLKTKKATVLVTLKGFINRRKQIEILTRWNRIGAVDIRARRVARPM